MVVIRQLAVVRQLPVIRQLHYIKCTQLNPPITEVITITIATITYQNKLGINPKWMNMQHMGSVSSSNIFPYFGHLVSTNAICPKRNAYIFLEIVTVTGLCFVQFNL